MLSVRNSLGPIVGAVVALFILVTAGLAKLWNWLVVGWYIAIGLLTCFYFWGLLRKPPDSQTRSEPETPLPCEFGVGADSRQDMYSAPLGDWQPDVSENVEPDQPIVLSGNMASVSSPSGVERCEVHRIWWSQNGRVMPSGDSKCTQVSTRKQLVLLEDLYEGHGQKLRGSGTPISIPFCTTHQQSYQDVRGVFKCQTLGCYHVGIDLDGCVWECAEHIASRLKPGAQIPIVDIPPPVPTPAPEPETAILQFGQCSSVLPVIDPLVKGTTTQGIAYERPKKPQAGYLPTYQELFEDRDGGEGGCGEVEFPARFLRL